MAEKPVQEIMAASLEKIRDLVDSNTVIGSPIHTQDGTTILPISKISFGFVSGGTDFATKTQKDLFGGAASAGGSVTPVGFLVIKDGSVKLMQLAEGGATVDRLINMMPEVIDRIEGFVASRTGKKDTTVKTEVEFADQVSDISDITEEPVIIEEA
ncbi:MAG: GerW family sporulation protein [Oscillospiraceae bacterium]|nr:GerW family sporulation protein [Oscillospiraceae bacterium]MBR2502689.1 GerW family sporulation protein [Oscillospiraceae bacterium]